MTSRSGARFIEFPMEVPHAGDATGEEVMEVMYPRCAGLDVHKETVVLPENHIRA